MKLLWPHSNEHLYEETASVPEPTPPSPESAPAEHHHMKHKVPKIVVGVLVFVAVVLIAARIYLPYWVTDYVNKTIDNIPGYTGSISDVDIHLYRGAYTIHNLTLNKKTNDIPVPFLDIKSTDLSLQWGALFNGRVVGDVTMNQPTINFATGKSGATSQTGVETDWTRPIKDLMPLDINLVEIHNGKVAYKNFATRPNVDVFINNLELKATNVRNVEDKNVALPSDLTASGTSIGNGKLQIDGKLNILRPVPDMDIKGKLESVNLPALNNYARAFAAIDFNSGNFDLYSDLKVKDGKVSGFVKPLLRNIDLIDWKNPDPNPLNVLWESVVSVVMEIFTNQSKDQIATQIQLEGDLSNPETDFWSTLNGILRNAFVKAYSNTVKEE